LAFAIYARGGTSAAARLRTSPSQIVGTSSTDGPRSFAGSRRRDVPSCAPNPPRPSRAP